MESAWGSALRVMRYNAVGGPALLVSEVADRDCGILAGWKALRVMQYTAGGLGDPRCWM